MKFIKKLISFESLIIWLRYFKTVSLQSIIMNFVIPIGISILYYFNNKNNSTLIPFNVFTISSILVGFCSSILVMLFTLDGPSFNKLKEVNLKQTKDISLHQALIYKFSFIVINLINLMFVEILSVVFVFGNCIFYKVYLVFIITNTIFTLIESLINVAFCLSNKTKS